MKIAKARRNHSAAMPLCSARWDPCPVACALEFDLLELTAPSDSERKANSHCSRFSNVRHDEPILQQVPAYNKGHGLFICHAVLEIEWTRTNRRLLAGTGQTLTNA